MNGTKFQRNPSERYYKLALALMALAWAVVLTWAAWHKLNTLGMGFDLGMYEQVIWNTAHGRPFATSAFRYTTNHIGSDLIVMEALIAPIYAIAPGTMTLLFLQVVTVALGALPLYLLARDRLQSPLAGVLAAAAYLLYVPLLYLTLNEFQPRAFALVCVLFASYYLDKSRFRPFLLFLFLSLLTRSDVALFVIMMGVLAFVWRKPWRFTPTPIVLGSVWFVAALFVIVPYFKSGGGGFVYLDLYGWMGKTPGEILTTLVTRPGFVLGTIFSDQKVRFLIEVFGPAFPFTLIRPDVLLLSAPTLALNLLSRENVQSNITRQYAAMLYPVVYASAILGIAWLANQKWVVSRIPHAVVVYGGLAIVLVLTIAQSFVVGNPVLAQLKSPVSPRIETVRALVSQVPPDAGLGLSNHVGPFAAQRQGFYFFPPHEFYTHNTFQVSDYILVDVRADGSSDPVKAGLERLKSDQAWKLLANRDGYMLYQKRAGF